MGKAGRAFRIKTPVAGGTAAPFRSAVGNRSRISGTSGTDVRAGDHGMVNRRSSNDGDPRVDARLGARISSRGCHEWLWCAQFSPGCPTSPRLP